MSNFNPALVCFSVGLLLSSMAHAYRAPVVERGVIPELSSGAQGPSQDPVTPELIAQMELLAQAMRELRGQLEEQNHRIEQLEKQQLSQYQDLDSRLSELKISPLQAEVTAPVAQTAPKVASLPVSREDQGRAQQALYQSAYTLLRDKKYQQAEPILHQYLSLYPNGYYAVNAHYWLGELLLLSGKIQEAKVEFNTVADEFANSGKAADAMLKLGFIYSDEGQTRVAREQFQKVLEKFPDSPASQLAEQRLSLLNG